MILLFLLACAMNEEASRIDSGANDSARPLPVGVELVVGDGWTLDVAEASHPRVAFGDGLEARVVFDGGAPASAWAVDLSVEGPGEPWQHIEEVGGFSTPDLAWSGSGWSISARVASQVALTLDGSDEPSLLPLGRAAPLPFVSAPRIVSTAEGTGVVWWEPRPAADPDGDVYWLSWRTPSGDVANPVSLARAGGPGSPLAAAVGPDGWWVAWSDDEGVMVARAAGDQPGAPIRVDQGGLVDPARPALALDGSGAMAVGWRQQGPEQNGQGVRLRIWDSAGEPVTDELTLGLAPDQANRIALATHGGVLVAAWDEGGGDEGDVAIQFFDMAAGEAMTGPMVAHMERAGRQQRPSVAISSDAMGWTAHVVFEDEERITGTVVRLKTPL